MTEKEKIKQYIDYKNISKNKFYANTGLSMGFLDSGSSLGVDKAKIIIDKYPDLSVEWLVLGKGDMIVSSVKGTQDINDRLLVIIESQQRTIESMAETNKKITVHLADNVACAGVELKK